MSNELSFEGSEAVALIVREELARRRLSRQWLADHAKVSLSTLEKALAGSRPFTLATVVRLEDALGVTLRSREAQLRSFAPDAMGAYTRPAVQWLEGTYLTLRPSFSEPGAIFAYLTAIAWNDEVGHLVFKEAERIDSQYQQKGFVSFPNMSGAIYLVTVTEGQYRLATMNRPGGGGAMSGILLTLAAGAGAQLTPAAVPITLVPRQGADPQLGVVREGDKCFAEYRALVDCVVQQGYARFPA
ncbi:MAG TPA: helix-turn-helix transcriptional regulator [Sphingomicrobium sp.]|nr:helix-turn-helix transcriptional regulator [Sphingomicrobium sp.]